MKKNILKKVSMNYKKISNNKQNKGITLITLVITIIVLLVLARCYNKRSNKRWWNIRKG